MADALERWHGSTDLSPGKEIYGEDWIIKFPAHVDGNGRNPGEKELLAVGIAAGMEKSECRQIINQIQDCVHQMLRKYL